MKVYVEGTIVWYFTPLLLVADLANKNDDKTLQSIKTLAHG